MLNSSVSLLNNVLVKVPFAEFVQLCHVLLHLDCPKYLTVLSENGLFLLLLLLHLHKLPYFALPNH